MERYEEWKGRQVSGTAAPSEHLISNSMSSRSPLPRFCLYHAQRIRKGMEGLEGEESNQRIKEEGRPNLVDDP